MVHRREPDLIRLVNALVVWTALATSLAGCSHNSGPQTYAVDVGGVNLHANETFDAYFPSVLQVHAGDAVVFHFLGDGEPQTVAFGTLVDNAVKAFDTLGPSFVGQPPPDVVQADETVPTFFPLGTGDVVAAGADQCFLESGSPPTGGPCPVRRQPELDGTQSFYNSGYVPVGGKFVVHLSPHTRPGTYRYMCTLHREDMSGKVVVVPKSTPVPSPSDQFAAGQRELAVLEGRLADAVARVRAGKFPVPGVAVPGGHVVWAGSGSPSVSDAEIDEFGPRVTNISVGESVTWFFLGDHSVTFGAPPGGDYILATSKSASGLNVHIDPSALYAVGAPGEPPYVAPSTATSQSQLKVVASVTWGGTGFLNSGVYLDSQPPLYVEGFSVTFTRAGIYPYFSTVNRNMTGSVIVS